MIRLLVNVSPWSSLKRIGQSPAARATILVPMIGYFILLHQEFAHLFQFKVGRERPLCVLSVCVELTPIARYYFVYFGLFVVGLATLIFRVRCPETILRSDSLYAFIDQEMAIFTPSRLSEQLRRLDNIVPTSGNARERFKNFPVVGEGAKITNVDLAAWRAANLNLIVDVSAMYHEVSDQNQAVSRFVVAYLYRCGLVGLTVPSLYVFALVVQGLLNGDLSQQTR